ncbi:MAG: biopolymer transporter ExbD [Gammaproteobacteria bacterium]|nr:biopolymer transporter ExbD [Gammaproteobacteria bacterium]
MQFEGNRRNSNVPNMTPLIDIVFLLLVFFMLTSHFVRDDALNIQLPETETGERLDEKKSIEIVINAEGQWLYKQQVLDADALRLALHNDLSRREDKIVRIRGDKSSDLGNAVTVLDIARQAGATGVDIVTERK